MPFYWLSPLFQGQRIQVEIERVRIQPSRKTGSGSNPLEKSDVDPILKKNQIKQKKILFIRTDKIKITIRTGLKMSDVFSFFYTLFNEYWIPDMETNYRQIWIRIQLHINLSSGYESLCNVLLIGKVEKSVSLYYNNSLFFRSNLVERCSGCLLSSPP